MDENKRVKLTVKSLTNIKKPVLKTLNFVELRTLAKQFAIGRKS